MALVRGWLAAYSCGVSSGVAGIGSARSLLPPTGSQSATVDRYILTSAMSAWPVNQGSGLVQAQGLTPNPDPSSHHAGSTTTSGEVRRRRTTCSTT